MRKLLSFSIAIFFIVSCAGTGIYSGAEKQETPGEFIPEDFRFSEMYLFHDTVTGKTELVLYNVFPESCIELTAETRLAGTLYSFAGFEIISEEYSTDRDMLTLRFLMQAENQLFHQDNLEEIIGKVLEKNTVVSDVDISFGKQYVISIVIEDIGNMYFPDGNSLGIYRNEKENKVMYLFDIASDPIEFLIGYGEK